MEIENIVIASHMYKEIKNIIEEKKLPYHFRFLEESEITQSDLDWADALVAFNLHAELVYNGLKWVHSLGAGVDHFIYKKKWNEKVLLTRTIGSFGQRISEYCLSYLLKDLQFHDHFDSVKSERKWQSITPKLLGEQKVMVYGTGEIGQSVARTLSSFGTHVYGVSLSGKEKEFFKEVLSVERHYSKLSEMDYLINTLPLTEKTEKLFDDHILQQLQHAGFINVGRGASVDECALLEALNHHHIRLAVLDVFAHEPLPEDHNLWKHPNVRITPHISAVTTPQEGVECFVETLKRIEENKPLYNMVDVSKGY
jgi:glyoxylate/hydroxypyruvate reductase A